MKKDLREYSDRELQMIIDNDEYLYHQQQRLARMTWNPNAAWEEFKEFLDENFICTQAQLEQAEEAFMSEIRSNEEETQ